MPYMGIPTIEVVNDNTLKCVFNSGQKKPMELMTIMDTIINSYKNIGACISINLVSVFLFYFYYFSHHVQTLKYIYCN